MIFFQFSIKMGSYGSTNLKTLLLPEIALEIFSNFSWIFLSVLFLKLNWAYDFSYSLIWDPLEENKCQNATPPSNRFLTSSKFLLNFLLI